MRPENGVFRADHRLRKFVGAFKIAVFLAATVSQLRISPSVFT